MGNINDTLAAHDRVWVVHWVHAAIVLPRLQEGYMDFEFVSQASFENAPEVPIADKEVDVYLFQKPDETPITAFGDDIVLQDAIFADALPADSPLYVDLWWQTNASLDRDYSVSLTLRDASGAVVAQADGPLADLPSSQWQVGEQVPQRFALTPPQTPATYSLTASVYYYETPDAPLQTASGTIMELGEVTISQP
jgi:hypothetical protein